MHLLEQLQSALGHTYSIERELGGGGMSRVFVAEEITLRRKVVIKVLSPDLAEAMSSDRFRREIALAARLQHPHIVPLYAASVVDGLPYYTMPFVEGRSLKDELDKGELPIAHALAILQDVASALAHAHSKGVIHRDIKPGNVLLAENAASVTDFGIAKALTDSVQVTHALTGTGVSLGTPAYMAPEQAAADPQSDHRADIYSFGVLAYEMLCGHTPFAGRSPQQMIAANAIEEPPRLLLKRRTIPPALDAIVHNCLAKSPADRPQSVAALLHSLQHPDTVKPARRAPHLAVVLAGVAVVALSLAGGIVWKYNAARAVFRPDHVAVAPFTDHTNNPALAQFGPYVSEVIRSGLTNLRQLKPVLSLTALNDWRLAALSSDSKSVVREFARRTKSRNVVVGTFSMRPGTDTIVFSTQIVNALTGDVWPAMPEIVVSLEKREEGAQSVRKSVAEKFRQEQNRAVIGLSSLPPKLAAYDYFLGGVDKFVKDSHEASIKLLTRASQIDPEFIVTYAYLAHAFIDLGRWKSADSCVQILDSLASRNETLVEKDIARAMTAAVGGNWAEEMNAWERLTATDPSFVGVYRRGVSALASNRPREAITIFRSIGDEYVEKGWPSYWLFLGVAHHVLKQYSEEEDAIRLGLKREEGVRELIDAEAAVLGARGNAKALDALFDSVAASWLSTSRITPLEVAVTGAAELEVHDHAFDAQKLLEKGRAWTFDGASRGVRAAKSGPLAIARLMFHTRHLDSARAILAPLEGASFDAGSHPDSVRTESLGWLGVIAVVQNDTVEARRIMALLGADNRQYTRGHPHYAMARVQASLGEKEKAVESIHRALDLGVRFGIDMHRDPAFAGLRGFPPFEQIVQPRS